MQLASAIPRDARDRRRTTLAQLVTLARDRGGACLATAYVNARTKLLWCCAEGHRWEATPDCVKAGTWCPSCAGRRADPLAEAEKLATARGGACLSLLYVSATTRMRWRCAADHEWHAALEAVQRGSWCRRCAMPGLREIRRLARSRGGRCLSVTLERRDQALIWICDSGHTWSAPWDRVARGAWCWHCAQEAQRGHRKPRITVADAQGLASAQGGACLSLAVTRFDAPLEWRCDAGHTWTAAYSNVRRGAWCPTCRAARAGGTIAAMQTLAAARGGRCRSEVYVHCEAKLSWECAAGHRWDATPRKIRCGRWCPRCASNHAGSLADMHALAASRGGACVSTVYVNATTRLRWRCAAGHEWTAIPASIKAGRWCPLCAVAARRGQPSKQ